MRTNVRVGAIIRNEDQVLLIHRFKNGEEYWVLPGGGVEDEESLEVALFREVMEETSLPIHSFSMVAECTREDRAKHVFFEVVAPGEPVLSGPEKDHMNETNQYILEWVSSSKAKKLTAFYPKEVQDYF